MMTRIFHPIGQGAFYTERFEKINVVYDCGCGVKENICKIGDEAVKQSFESTDEIDILFISHFDRDHINGIKTLKKHCKSIKNVVLPELNNIEKMLIISIYRALGFKEGANLIENPVRYFDEGTKIIRVESNKDQKEDNANDKQIIEEIDNINREDKKIKSGTEIVSSKDPNWCFIPYNYKYIERKGKLKKKLANDGLIIEKIVNGDSDYIINNLEKLEEVYKEILNKKLNENSMLLYSGPLEQKNNNALISSWHISLRYICHKHRILNRIGCIYTGDADLNKVKIRKIFDKKYLDSVGTVQIPHHGSRTSFKEDFFDGKFYFCPISAGRINSYKHPHHQVISSIFSNNALPIVINELPNFKFEQIIKRF